MRLYHATPAVNLKEIERVGLDPSRSKSNQHAVYLAGTPEDALNYVTMHANDFDAFVILAVEIDDDPVGFLGPDDYELRELLEEMSEEELAEADLPPDVEWADLGWRRSLELSGQVACLERIDQSAITLLGTVDATVTPLRIVEHPYRAASPS